MNQTITDIINVLRNFDPAAYVQNLTTNDVFTGFLGLSLLATATFLGRYLLMFSWRMFKKKFISSVVVHNDDQAFYWVALWMRENGYNEKIRFSVAVTRNSPQNNRPRFSGHPEDERTVILIPQSGTYFLHHQGIPFLLVKSQEEPRGMERPESFEIITFGRGRKLLQKIISEAKALSAGSDDVSVQTWDGHWYETAEKTPRSLDSVILPEQDKADIVKDFTWFMENQQWYMDRGIPYHRGYLFFGPPGTGKTSLSFALASHFKLKLCVLPLSSVNTDSQLHDVMTNVPSGSIVLIEDIDRHTVVQERGQDEAAKGAAEGKNITLSGLLNALDGVMATEGRIIIMTSNRPDIIDPALLRPGRIDVQKEIGLPTAVEKATMYLRFFPNDTAGCEEFVRTHGNGNMATFQEALLRKSMEERK